MARRLLPLALLAVLAIAGCSYGQPVDLTAQQESARIAFVEDHPGFDDQELARLCPGLYPSDFLTKPDDYPRADKDHRDPPVTQADRDQAQAAGCDVPSPE